LLKPRRLAEALLDDLDDAEWRRYLAPLAKGSTSGYQLHIAVMVEPYLEFLLNGRKTIESRFSVTKRAPYGRVRPGDVILFKRSGGPLAGLCRAAHVWFYELDSDAWKTIRTRFGRGICAQGDSFWKERQHACYATLIQVEEVRPLPPLQLKKRGRSGWVTFDHWMEQP
jgi:hypothetical protein